MYWRFALGGRLTRVAESQVNLTPFEPEWEGFVTLEISNTTPLPAKIYANEGRCQILFFRGEEACEISRADRNGKYRNQQGVVLPKLQVSDRLILFLEVCAFPPIRQK
jgi:deoxycytidine triphosphate deaminase